MRKEDVRRAIIEMGNGNQDNPESWIELTVKDLDWALNRLDDVKHENTGVKE